MTSRRLRGLPASPGIAAGPAFVLGPTTPAMTDGRHAPEASHGPEAQEDALARFGRAVEDSAQQLEAIRQRTSSPEAAATLQAEVLMLRDPTLRQAVKKELVRRGRPLETAVVRAVEAAAARVGAVADPYIRQRAADLRDAGERLLRNLKGVLPGPAAPERPSVIVSRDLSPSFLASVDPHLVLGLALAEGTPTSHVAIMAKAKGIPAVVGLGGALAGVAPGDTVALDGAAGTVAVNPSPAASGRHAEGGKARTVPEAGSSAVRRAAAAPACTVDGLTVAVEANIGDLRDLDQAVASGADGIGLFRTEFLFMAWGAVPGEEEQFQAYRQAAEAMAGRPVSIRTLDVGGDKDLAGLGLSTQESGLRGLAFSLAHEDPFRAQLRAIARAAACGRVRVLFPMATSVEELRHARRWLEEELAGLGCGGRQRPAGLEVGAMVEVPALALAAREAGNLVDFFSLGTNDLARVAGGPGSGTEPEILRLVAATVEGARAAGIPVGLCGELASDPAAIPLLIGLGVTALSVPPAAVSRVKGVVRATRAGR